MSCSAMETLVSTSSSSHSNLSGGYDYDWLGSSEVYVKLQRRVSVMQKLVHLDLKGAAPRLTYLEYFIPLVKSLGGTGLLLEWEDMFPYDHDLKSLACSRCYSKEDVKQIHKLAKQAGLFVVPLVQTFGHMEFVLKGPEFKHLREDSGVSQAINPHKSESRQLIYKMIDQQVALQADIKHLHIGADEVFYLGASDESKYQIETMGVTIGEIFLKHVRQVAEYCKKKYPHIELFLWDDMLRSIPLHHLLQSGLQELVTPVIWNYEPHYTMFCQRVPSEILIKYSKVFQHLWIASAFKGANGPRQCYASACFYFNNHLAWLRVLATDETQHIRIDGIMLTGWQRFNHFEPLCELLTVSIPSLAVCLTTMQTCQMNLDAMTSVSSILGCHIDELSQNLSSDQFKIFSYSFLGHEMVSGVQLIIRARIELGKNNDLFYWLNENPNLTHAEVGSSAAATLKEAYQNINHAQDIMNKAQDIMAKGLVQYFSEDTQSEWLNTYVTPLVNVMTSWKRRVEELLGTGVASADSQE